MRSEAEIRAQADLYRADCEWATAEAAKAHELGHGSLERACDLFLDQGRARLCMLSWVLGERTTPGPWSG